MCLREGSRGVSSIRTRKHGVAAPTRPARRHPQVPTYDRFPEVRCVGEGRRRDPTGSDLGEKSTLRRSHRSTPPSLVPRGSLASSRAYRVVRFASALGTCTALVRYKDQKPNNTSCVGATSVVFVPMKTIYPARLTVVFLRILGTK